MLGPLVGPIVGGIIGQFLGWQNLFFILSIVGFFIFLAVIFFLPETLDKSVPRKLPNPLQPLGFLLHPPIALLTMTNCLMFSCLFSDVIILPIIFDEKFELNQLEIGFTTTPNGFALMIGMLTGGRLSDLFSSQFGRGGRILPLVCVAFTMIIPGSILIGYVIDKSVHATIIINFFICFSMTFQRPGMSVFCIEERPKAPSSIMACISCTNFAMAAIISAIVPIFLDDPFYFFLTLSGILLLFWIPCIYLVYRNWNVTISERKQ